MDIAPHRFRSRRHDEGARGLGEMLEAWEARLAGDTADAEGRFDAARSLAAVRAHRYLPAVKVAQLLRAALLERIEATAKRDGRPDLKEAAALLGGEAEPPISVRRALDIYWTIAKDRTLGKSEDQLCRWKNPRLKAVESFVKVVGNKPLSAITGG